MHLKALLLTPPVLPLFQAERVVGRVRSAVGRSGRPFEEVANLPKRLLTMALLWLPTSCIPQACEMQNDRNMLWFSSPLLLLNVLMCCFSPFGFDSAVIDILPLYFS